MALPRIDQWKRRLLDLSLRNPLLNIRDSSRYLPLDGGDKFIPCDTGEETFIKSTLPEKELRNRLKSLYLTSRSMLVDSGINSLFLIYGFLYWNDKDGEELHRAPLSLIPVKLTRQTQSPGYKLERTDEDIAVNFCLSELLRTQFSLPIKDVDGGGFGDGDPDMDEIFSTFADAVKDKKDWHISKEIGLGIFSFSKIVIWKDLVDNEDAFLKHPFVSALAKGEGWHDDGVKIFPQEDVEKHIDPKKLYCPLEADSSQLAAVLYSQMGKSFVLHGQPGTGKSQTIANMISQNLAHGRKVLFVSEKKAALDVVYKRLSDIGLGPFCLELHSNKADKANVMRQFREALDAKSGCSSRWNDVCKSVKKISRRFLDILKRYTDHVAMV